MAATQAPRRIAITTGDTDGIGFEITAKALAKLRPQRDISFLLWRSPKAPKRDLQRIDRVFKRITVSSWPEALKVSTGSPRELIDVASNLPPPMWVEISAQARHYGHIQGMVTAPLSKIAIKSAGMEDMGHTGILKRVSGRKDLFMGFIGDKFNVLLATGHMPISDVTSSLTASRLEAALAAASELRAVLPSRVAQRPLAVLGMNPHAGEQGLIGHVEEKVHTKALETMRTKTLPIEGPLVPDAAFFPANWKKYSVFVACYHDQGLIPFKMIHGQESGIQITMGLPFVRTSVDHGTAKDIFGKDKADPRSMLSALEWAIRLVRQKELK